MAGGDHRQSIPYTSGSVVGYSFDSFLLSFLCQVVEEEVDEDGIDLDVGLEQQDLATKEFNSPDAAA